jgi:hypothetical protein
MKPASNTYLSLRTEGRRRYDEIKGRDQKVGAILDDYRHHLLHNLRWLLCLDVSQSDLNELLQFVASYVCFVMYVLTTCLPATFRTPTRPR